MNAGLILIPILLPVAAGACLPLFHFKERKARERYVTAAVLATSLALLFLILNRPEGVITLLPLTEDLSIAFRMDGLSCVFLGLVGFLWPLASCYAFEYIKHEGMDDKFFSFYTMTYGVTVGIAASANLITMYLCYELLTLVTLPLVMHAMNNRAVAAGRKYLAYSIGGAALAFAGIMILYVYGDKSLTFVYGGFVNPAVNGGERDILLAGYLLTFFGFGVKAAVFPFHGWLPSAGVAPTPVTALLHAVAVVKAGVFAIMRSTFYCFGTGLLAGTWAQEAAMIFAMATILFGSAMAWRDLHIKRRLAYSTVSNLSYIVFGVTLMTPAGFTGALCHMIFHGLMKITLFFCAGAVMYKTHREYVTELDGFGAGMPVTFAAFTIASLALTGVPLLPGFISKWSLATAAASTGEPLAFAGVLVLLASAVLTAAYLFTVVVRAYFPGVSFDRAKIADVRDPNWYMCVPLGILCGTMVFLGLCSPLLTNLLAQVAGGLV
ncbi:MAG: proton-conducting membrane transporter [Lachnospiraceae bacterium]|nr:proton-conducting membrane transporter [Lachnospiraceae bacterium]